MSEQTKQTKLSKSKRLAGNLSFDGEDRKEDHFFCAFETEACDHENCQPRVFAEEDYKYLFDKVGVKKFNGERFRHILLTPEREQQGNHRLMKEKIVNRRLENFGAACALLGQLQYMPEVLNRCQYDYQRDSILSGFFQYNKSEINAIHFIDSVPKHYTISYYMSSEPMVDCYRITIVLCFVRHIHNLMKEVASLNKQYKTARKEIEAALREQEEYQKRCIELEKENAELRKQRKELEKEIMARELVNEQDS